MPRYSLFSDDDYSTQSLTSSASDPSAPNTPVHDQEGDDFDDARLIADGVATPIHVQNEAQAFPETSYNSPNPNEYASPTVPQAPRTAPEDHRGPVLVFAPPFPLLDSRYSNAPISQEQLHCYNLDTGAVITAYLRDVKDWSDEAISELKCPLTLEIFTTPVSATDGNTYDKNAIDQYITHRLSLPQQSITTVPSPMNNLPMSTKLTHNYTLQKLINSFIIEINQSAWLTAQDENTAPQNAAPHSAPKRKSPPCLQENTKRPR